VYSIPDYRDRQLESACDAHLRMGGVRGRGKKGCITGIMTCKLNRSETGLKSNKEFIPEGNRAKCLTGSLKPFLGKVRWVVMDVAYNVKG